MKLSSILGLNARSGLFSYKYNSPLGRKIANSKLQTARVLKKADVPIPQVFRKFRNPQDIFTFDFNNLAAGFALKPSRGLGGEGIIVVKKRLEDGSWMTTQRTKVTNEDLKLHILDILEGAYSIGGVPDVAFIQEFVGRHKAFRKYAYRGTPDIRIIVFNKVPVMAMLRLPTRESGGRANLHQGAIGVGVDIATGITTKAIWHGDYIRRKPGTNKLPRSKLQGVLASHVNLMYVASSKSLFLAPSSVRLGGRFSALRNRKLHGIRIPNWTLVLETAVKAQIVSRLGYVGVDIVLHPEKGPLVLELNAQPGLQIQLANMAGLKKRVERIEDLEVRDAEHGVKIAKALFAERFADRVKAEEGVKILNVIENVKVYSFDKRRKVGVVARVDTGAVRSSIDKGLAKDLGLLTPENILWKDRYQYRSTTGLQTRPIIGFTLAIAGRKIRTTVSVADRSKLSTHLLIGRNDLTGFLVNPETDEEKRS